MFTPVQQNKHFFQKLALYNCEKSCGERAGPRALNGTQWTGAQPWSTTQTLPKHFMLMLMDVCRNFVSTRAFTANTVWKRAIGWDWDYKMHFIFSHKNPQSVEYEEKLHRESENSVTLAVSLKIFSAGVKFCFVLIRIFFRIILHLETDCRRVDKTNVLSCIPPFFDLTSFAVFNTVKQKQTRTRGVLQQMARPPRSPDLKIMGQRQKTLRQPKSSEELWQLLQDGQSTYMYLPSPQRESPATVPRITNTVWKARPGRSIDFVLQITPILIYHLSKNIIFLENCPITIRGWLMH